MPNPNFAVVWGDDAYKTAGKVMGRNAAGAGLLRAIVQAEPTEFSCCAATRRQAEGCLTELRRLGARDLRLRWVPRLAPSALASDGLLYRPDPGLAEEAWRRAAVGDDLYGVIGVTHTLPTLVVRTMITNMVDAPVMPWDALVCTSSVARDAVTRLLDGAEDNLRRRVGATRFTRPQLPVIPLGVHTADYAFTPGERAEARMALGLEPDEVVVLFAGRLIAHGKAHPVPMYLALEQAAQGRKVVLIQAGAFPAPSIEEAYREEVLAFCPSVRARFVNGSDPQDWRRAWAGADIFTSLADNYQETFGLTPVEAMAAGLPQVVSDWNGYRDTVRDNVEGLLVRTLAPPPGDGQELADRYTAGVSSWDEFCAHTSQLVAVDIEGAAQAYRRLIDDPELRGRLGAAGRQRARTTYEWSVVYDRYRALGEELNAVRARGAAAAAPRSPSRAPDRADPFATFSSFPSHVVGNKIEVSLVEGVSPDTAAERAAARTITTGRLVHPSPELVATLLDRISGQAWCGYPLLVQACPGHSAGQVRCAVAWLAKFGVLRFRPASAG